MKVLGIETSGNIGGVAVCENKHVIVAKGFGAGMQHGKELIPAIRTTLHEIGWKPRDIDLIAVDVGPGSYTGLRVGVACAKTLAYALNKPVVDVPIFDIIAESYTIGSIPICPIIDARRNHVYACIYTMEGAQRKRLTEFLVIQPEKLLSILPRPVIIFGDGVAPYKDIFQQKDIIIDEEAHAIPNSRCVALLGGKMYDAGHRCEIDKLLPLYLRRAEAVEKREGKK
ncbi:MAG: tRNA (adenosine(37)-N6)-threonylcarbamoyltransferase complex dimerization subunit type 1 TsaB [Planctomycetes bacterium]|nr:tRNA (adenosine(37)-N6)-threonylcarbamoyltransferase complex dimerization subunit type 1 TsaB [Planctomycetota bacterium]